MYYAYNFIADLLAEVRNAIRISIDFEIYEASRENDHAIDISVGEYKEAFDTIFERYTKKMANKGMVFNLYWYNDRPEDAVILPVWVMPDI